MKINIERVKGLHAWLPRRYFYSASEMPDGVRLDEQWSGPAICGWTATKWGARRKALKAADDLRGGE